MGSLGTAQLICLLLAVATVAAVCGFIASALTRRNKRRTRRVFLVGVFCGLLAGSTLRGRRAGARYFATRTAAFADTLYRVRGLI
jgi:MFS-type transporter involved in bile tolerance (Atg22 family)